MTVTYNDQNFANLQSLPPTETPEIRLSRLDRLYTHRTPHITPFRPLCTPGDVVSILHGNALRLLLVSPDASGQNMLQAHHMINLVDSDQT